MNEAKYLTKNYGDRGGCYPSRLQAEADNTLRDLRIILHMIRKPKSIIVSLFIQNNSQFKNIAKTCLPPSILSSSSPVHVQGCSTPQVFSKQQMSPLKFSSCCSCHVFSYYFAQVLLLKRVKCLPFFVFTTKPTQPRSQVFSVDSSLTCKNGPCTLRPI